MGVFDFLFGGEDNSAQDAQIQANRENRELFKQLAERARQDALSLFPMSQQASRDGMQASLDLFGQTIPQRMNVFQQGMQGAQDAQLRGLKNIQAALMGQPINMSNLGQHLRPIQYDTSFAQQTLPNPQPINLQPSQALGGPDPEIQRYLRQFGGLF